MTELTVARSTRRPVIGLVSAGLGEYWPQFPGLLDELERCTRRITERLGQLGADVVDAGFISWPTEAPDAGRQLRSADVDLLIVNLATYATSAQILPAVQRAGAPVLVIDLQPSEKMDHPNTDTGKWLAYCNACTLPELSSVFQRCGIPFRSVTGYLEDENAWGRIADWVHAASVRTAYRNGRFGLLGHLYNGMLDIQTDPTLVHAQLGGHVEILEMDDLRVRVEAAKDKQIDEVLARARETFTLADTVVDEDLQWAARCAVGLNSLVDDFGLDMLSYYYRGLEGELYERLGAGLILGSSLLTGDGVPCAGEYDLRTGLAMLTMERIGAGGSFTEFQAINFEDGVVEMGHDGPAHLAISDGKPILRGLGVYHGKRGFGVSVEFSVKTGPVTMLGLAQKANGDYRFVVAEGEVVPGPTLTIGNTTSRVDFGVHPGEWVDAWCQGGTAHHWALGVGHRAETLRRVADLAGIEFWNVSV